MVALYERKLLFGAPDSPVAGSAKPITVLPIEVGLTSIVNLTASVQAALIGTNAQELTGDWLYYLERKPDAHESTSPHWGQAPTQLLRAELFGLGKFKGLISFSARLPQWRILVVFPERLNLADSLSYSYTDSSGARQARRRP